MIDKQLIKMSELVNSEFAKHLKKHNIPMIQLVGVSEKKLYNIFEDTLIALDKMSEVKLPEVLVNYYNDVVVDKLEEVSDEEESKPDEIAEVTEPEETVEDEEKELGEEVPKDEEEPSPGITDEESAEESVAEEKESDNEVDADAEGEPESQPESQPESADRKPTRTRKVKMPDPKMGNRKRTSPTGNFESTERKRKVTPNVPRGKNPDEKPKKRARKVKDTSANVKPKPKKVVADKSPTKESAGLYATIDRKAILAELRRIKPKKTKDTASSYDLIAFRNGDMISYNQSQALLYKLPDDSMSMDFGLSAFNLKVALESIKTKVITLTENESNIMIMGGNIAIKLHKYSDDYVSSLYESLGVRRSLEQFMPIPDGFIKAISSCAEIATKNSDNLRMMHTVKVGNEAVYANSGYQSIRFKVDSHFEDFYLLKQSVDTIVKFQPQAYFINKQWAHFVNTDDTILSIRLVTQNPGEMFVDTDNLFEIIDNGFSFGTDIEEKDLKSLSQFSSNDGTQVCIDVEGNAILTSSGLKGEITISTQVINYTEKHPVTFNIDPLVLKLCVNSNGMIKVNATSIQMSNDVCDYLIALLIEE